MITALTPALTGLAFFFPPSLTTTAKSLRETASFPGSVGKRAKHTRSHKKTIRDKNTAALPPQKDELCLQSPDPPAAAAGRGWFGGSPHVLAVVAPAHGASVTAGSSPGLRADPAIAPATERLLSKPVSGILGVSPGMALPTACSQRAHPWGLSCEMEQIFTDTVNLAADYGLNGELVWQPLA